MKIETERLILRQWSENDKDSFYRLNSDPIVMRYFPKLLSREESDAFVDKSKAFIEEKGWGFFASELKESGDFIGFIGLSIPSYTTHFTPCTEIGWRLHQRYWKKGYATEGAQAVLNFAFDTLGKEEIVSFTSTLNGPSIAVMERIGMTRDDKGDFDHPKVEEGHKLKKHVLYRIKRSSLIG